MQKIEVGDKVRYLNQVGSGIVKRILDNKLAEIEDDSGFDVPVLMTELVIIEKVVQQTSTQKERKYSFEQEDISVKAPVLEKKAAKKINIGNPKLYFAFTKSLVGDIQMHLINDSNFDCLYTVALLDMDMSFLLDAGLLEANTKTKLGEKTVESIQKFSNVNIQGLVFAKTQHKYESPIQTKLNINKINFDDINFKDNDFFDENAMVLNLTESREKEKLKNISAQELKKAMFSKNNSDSEQPLSKKHRRNIAKEIDLHIHELIEDESGLTPGDKLDLQLKNFKQELEAAIVDNVEKIVFIHGVGNGVLKMKIRSILDRDYSKYEYQDASFQQYKFGATLVLLN